MMTNHEKPVSSNVRQHLGEFHTVFREISLKKTISQARLTAVLIINTKRISSYFNHTLYSYEKRLFVYFNKYMV